MVKAPFRNISLLFVATVSLTALAKIAMIACAEYNGVQRKPHAVALPKEFKYELQTVSIRNSEGDLLKAWYAKSRNGGNIILLHGYGGNRREMLPEAEFLMAAGFGVLLFDSRAQGESEGNRITYGIAEANDLNAVFQWLAKQSEVDSKKIAGLGFSNGAVALARNAAVTHQFAAIILNATPSSLFDFVHDQSRPLPDIISHVKMASISLSIFENAYQSDSSAIIAQVSPTPLLIIHGAKDEVVRIERMAHLVTSAKEPMHSLVLPNSEHGLFMKSDPELYSHTVLDFLRNELKVSLLDNVTD